MKFAEKEAFIERIADYKDVALGMLAKLNSHLFKTKLKNCSGNNLGWLFMRTVA